MYRINPRSPRVEKPPRLYLDPQRRTWCIRFRTWFKRTTFREDQEADARAYLEKILKHASWARALRTLNPVLKPSVPRPPPQKKRVDTVGFVYFISKVGSAEYPIKIGFSAEKCPQFKKRLSNLQIGNPEPLEIMVSQPAIYGDEQAIQRALGEYRKIGEWFTRSPVVMAALTAARQGQLHEWLRGRSAGATPPPRSFASPDGDSHTPAPGS